MRWKWRPRRKNNEFPPVSWPASTKPLNYNLRSRISAGSSEAFGSSGWSRWLAEQGRRTARTSFNRETKETFEPPESKTLRAPARQRRSKLAAYGDYGLAIPRMVRYTGRAAQR